MYRLDQAPTREPSLPHHSSRPSLTLIFSQQILQLSSPVQLQEQLPYLNDHSVALVTRLKPLPGPP